MSYTPYPTAHISFSAILHIFFSPFHHRLTQAIFFISHTHAAVFCPWNLHLFCPRSPSPCVPLVMISSPQSSAVGATPRLPHPSGYCLSFCLRLPFREILTHSFPRSFKHFGWNLHFCRVVTVRSLLGLNQSTSPTHTDNAHYPSLSWMAGCVVLHMISIMVIYIGQNCSR